MNTSWVDVHYTLNGGGQQNLRMTYNGASARYEQGLTVKSGDTIRSSFTYSNGAPAHDTPASSYTVGAARRQVPAARVHLVHSRVLDSSSQRQRGHGPEGHERRLRRQPDLLGVLGINPANGRWSYLDLEGTLQPISAGLNDAPGHLSKNGVNHANIYHRVSDAAWASLPRLDSGRLFLCVGTPCFIKTYDTGFAGPDVNNLADPNRDVSFDFVEFTVNASGYHGNTTRVDGFGFPLEHRLMNRAGSYDRTVGEPESETRAGLFGAYSAQVPAEFRSLASVQAPYRIVAPIDGDFRASGPQGHYFDAYVNSVWISTQEILLCNGNAADPAACAAVNRHVYQDRASWNTPGAYYGAAPANSYAQFWHRHSLSGLAYDDVNGQAAYLEVGDPRGLIVRVGW